MNFRHIISRLTTKSLTMALLLILSAAYAYGQTVVRGKVTDSSGQPLSGVTVLIQGTMNGTMTDGDGHYSITAKNGETLEFSCLGLATQTHKYNGKSEIGRAHV